MHWYRDSDANIELKCRLPLASLFRLFPYNSVLVLFLLYVAMVKSIASRSGLHKIASELQPLACIIMHAWFDHLCCSCLTPISRITAQACICQLKPNSHPMVPMSCRQPCPHIATSSVYVQPFKIPLFQMTFVSDGAGEFVPKSWLSETRWLRRLTINGPRLGCQQYEKMKLCMSHTESSSYFTFYASTGVRGLINCPWYGIELSALHF